jgi:hypothetical protein
LIKDRDALLAFYDFPAEHWKHLRTTNVIESSFATVRDRPVRRVRLAYARAFPARGATTRLPVRPTRPSNLILPTASTNMLFIGTNDLCSSLGIPGQLDHDSIRNAYARSIEECRRHGKHLGVGGLNAYPKLAGEFVKLGARYVSTGTGLSFLLSAATARAKQMRDL